MNRGRPRKATIAEERWPDVVQAYSENGWSIRDIAVAFKVTTYVVNDILEKMEVEKRKRGNPNFGPNFIRKPINGVERVEE